MEQANEKVTAKVYVSSLIAYGDGQVQVGMTADYNDGRNKEWAKYTPALSINMTVRSEVAERHFPAGRERAGLFGRLGEAELQRRPQVLVVGVDGGGS